MPLIYRKIGSGASIFIILVGLISFSKYIIIEFSMTNAEGANLFMRSCLFVLFSSGSISGFISIFSLRFAWVVLLVSQLFSISLLLVTNNFGRGSISLNYFALQHLTVVFVALTILLYLDLKIRK